MQTNLVTSKPVEIPTLLADGGWCPRLRDGLELRPESGGGGWILCSESCGQERSITFGAHEFRLASALDGTRTVSEIRDFLAQIPGLESLCIEHVTCMIDWMRDMGLLELSPHEFTAPVAEPEIPEGKAFTPSAAEGQAPFGKHALGHRLLRGMAHAACIALLVGGSYFGVGWLRSEAGFTVKADAVAEGVTDDESGQMVSVTAKFDGVVRELYVRDGDKVVAGELLGLVDTLKISRQLNTLRSELEACQLERDALYSSGELVAYRRQVERMATLTRMMGQLRLEEECIELRAPCAGVIRSVDGARRQVGEQVALGQALLSVDRSEMEMSSPFLVTSSTTP